MILHAPSKTAQTGIALDRVPPAYSLAPTSSGLRYLDVKENVCYLSIARQGWHPEGSYVNLQWKGFISLNSAAVSGYQIFRRTRDLEYNYSAPIATITPSTVRSYIDVIGHSDFSDHKQKNGQVLFYTVLPIAASNQHLIFPQEKFSEIAVVLPPYNMIMVPRRVANAEICGHLLQTPDISNNNRCSHAGVINNYGAIQYPDGKSYFELTKDLMIDRFEYGCDYTSAIVAVNDCKQKPCYSNQGPVAAGANAGTRYRANAFYDRSSGICYLYDGNGGSGNWTAAGDLNSTQIASEFVSGTNSISVGMRGRLAGLPPLTNIAQAKAQAVCTARNQYGPSHYH